MQDTSHASANTPAFVQGRSRDQEIDGSSEWRPSSYQHESIFNAPVSKDGGARRQLHVSSKQPLSSKELNPKKRTRRERSPQPDEGQSYMLNGHTDTRSSKKDILTSDAHPTSANLQRASQDMTMVVFGESQNGHSDIKSLHTPTIFETRNPKASTAGDVGDTDLPSSARNEAQLQQTGTVTLELNDLAAICVPLECFTLVGREITAADDPKSSVHAADVGDNNVEFESPTPLICRVDKAYLTDLPNLEHADILDLCQDLLPEMQCLGLGLQMDHVTHVYMPLRLNYLRHGCAQIALCLHLHHESLGFTEDEIEEIIQPFEEQWFKYSKFLESQFTVIYDSLQCLIINMIPDMHKLNTVGGRHPGQLMPTLMTNLRNHFKAFEQTYEDGIKKIQNNWNEVSELVRCLIGNASPVCLGLLDLPFQYQPTWSPYPVDGVGITGFPAAPVLPELPSEAIAAGLLAVQYGHYDLMIPSPPWSETEDDKPEDTISPDSPEQVFSTCALPAQDGSEKRVGRYDSDPELEFLIASTMPASDDEDLG